MRSMLVRYELIVEVDLSSLGHGPSESFLPHPPCLQTSRCSPPACVAVRAVREEGPAGSPRGDRPRLDARMSVRWEAAPVPGRPAGLEEVERVAEAAGAGIPAAQGREVPPPLEPPEDRGRIVLGVADDAPFRVGGDDAGRA